MSRTVRSAPADAGVATSSTSLLDSLKRVDWHRYVIYIAFVVVFLFFSVLLGDQGFLTPEQPAQHPASDSHDHGDRRRDDLRDRVCGDRPLRRVGGALASVSCAMAISNWGLVPGILAGLAVGLLVGLINGLLTTKVRIPSFLVTLGMMSIVTGMARVLTDLEAVPVTDDGFAWLFGSGSVGPIPVLLVWTAVAMVVFHVVFRRTPFGRQVLATGGNRTAARFSGIRTDRIKIAALMISAGTAAVAGMLYAGRLQSGRFQWGAGDELSAIAAVILGGTSLFGGSGAVVGTMFGALLIGLINNGLILAGLDSSQQQVVRGVIIILAVALARKK